MYNRDNPLLQPEIVESPNVWERRKDESFRAYAAFLIYRDSENRRLADVASKLIPPCSVPNIARWCVGIAGRSVHGVTIRNKIESSKRSRPVLDQRPVNATCKSRWNCNRSPFMAYWNSRQRLRVVRH